MNERSELAARLDALHGVCVLCVGDIMLDRYVEGAAERISPEAPVPVLRVERQSAMLGGAGNVARNLAALGATARLVAIVGGDEAAREVIALADAQGGLTHDLIADPDRRTAIKTRYLAAGQQLLRADDESTGEITGAVEAEIIGCAMAALADCGAVVLSDYGKGALTDGVIAAIVAAAAKQNVPVLIDPKGGDYRRYRGARLVTPNRKELAEASGLPTGTDSEVALAAQEIIDISGIAAVLATRGADGITLLESGGELIYLPTEAREVFDVSGAGDTVIAAIAAGLAAGFSLADSGRLANAAAGIVVGKTGTAVARVAEIAAALEGRGEGKLVPLERLHELVAGWRREGHRVGFTNGCFDLLHRGHFSLLAQARAACDRLIVALNSDDSARRLKGDGRPVNAEADRALALGSLVDVDLVVIFGEDTPIVLIEAIRPDLLVKGADYTLDQVVGADIVQGYGGKVLLAELEPGHSTSATIAKLAR